MQHQIIIDAAPCLYRFPMNEIMAVKADGNYSTIYLTSGEQVTVLKQIGQIEKAISEQVPERESTLAKLGRSYIANIDQVFMIDLGHHHRLVLRSPDAKVKVTLEPPRVALKSLYESMKGM